MRGPQVRSRQAPEAVSALPMCLESEAPTGPPSRPPRRAERRHRSGARAVAGGKLGTGWRRPDLGVASGRLPRQHCSLRPQMRQWQQRLIVVLIEPLGVSPRPVLPPHWSWQRFVCGRHSHCPLRCRRCRHCLHSPYYPRQRSRCCCCCCWSRYCSHCCSRCRCSHCCCFGVLPPHPGLLQPGGL